MKSFKMWIVCSFYGKKTCNERKNTLMLNIRERLVLWTISLCLKSCWRCGQRDQYVTNPQTQNWESAKKKTLLYSTFLLVVHYSQHYKSSLLTTFINNNYVADNARHKRHNKPTKSTEIKTNKPVFLHSYSQFANYSQLAMNWIVLPCA